MKNVNSIDNWWIRSSCPLCQETITSPGHIVFSFNIWSRNHKTNGRNFAFFPFACHNLKTSRQITDYASTEQRGWTFHQTRIPSSSVAVNYPTRYTFLLAQLQSKGKGQISRLPSSGLWETKHGTSLYTQNERNAHKTTNHNRNCTPRNPHSEKCSAVPRSGPLGRLLWAQNFVGRHFQKLRFHFGFFLSFFWIQKYLEKMQWKLNTSMSRFLIVNWRLCTSPYTEAPVLNFHIHYE